MNLMVPLEGCLASFPESRAAMIGEGAYSLRDAAQIIRVPYQRLRRWAVGYWYSVADEEHFSRAVVAGETDELEERILSFVELMELFVVDFFRREGVSMPVIRIARRRAQQLFETDYPFANESLQTDGRWIYGDVETV